MFRKLQPFFFMMLSFSLILLTGCASEQELLSGLSEADANQVIVVLQSQDIVAKKTSIPGRKVTFTLSVNDSNLEKALKILVDNKLPKAQSPGLAEVYPLGGGGLIPSATQEKAQLMMALQGEIENMLLVLPGIVQARVVVVLPDTKVIRDPDTPAPQSTASVAVVYNPIDEKGKASVTSGDLRSLISSAIPDLSAENVTVVMAPNHPLKLVDSNRPAFDSVTTELENNDKTLAKESSPDLSAAYRPTEKPKATEQKDEDPQVAIGMINFEDKDNLVKLFGGLAGLGLLLGVLGILRAIVLRARIKRMQAASAEEA